MHTRGLGVGRVHRRLLRGRALHMAAKLTYVVLRVVRKVRALP